MKRFFRTLLVGVAVCAVLGCIAAWYGVYHVAPYAILLPSRPPESDPVYGITPESIGLLSLHCGVPADSAVVLDAWFLPARGEPCGTVLLLHGIGSVKQHMLSGAATLVEAGYNAVVFDLRAHGQSTGQYCTYGFYERADVSRVIDIVIQRFGAQEPIGIIGNSLGGAIALQAMAQDKRIVCGVVESTFAALDDVVYEYQREMLSVPFRFVAREALTEACRLAHFNAAAVRPEESARRIQCPVLLAHGEADERIPVAHGQRIFRALASPFKEWVLVPGAGHNTLAAVGGESYSKHKMQFLRQWMRIPATSVRAQP